MMLTIYQGMAKNLAQKANLSSPLLLYNRTQSKAVAHAESIGGPSKAQAVASIGDAVKPSDIIFSCVGEDAAVQGIIDTALDSVQDVKGKLFVEMSTIHPDTTRKLDSQLRSRGASFVSCPVFGVAAMANAGLLICVLSGHKNDVAKVLPYTVGVISRANIDLSYDDSSAVQDISKASTLKLIGNSFILSFVEQLGEGLTLAEKSGVGIEPLVQWIDLMFPGPLAKYTERMKTGDYWKCDYPPFPVDLARKDLRHVTDVARQSGMQMKSLEVVDGYLKGVKDHAGERGDLAGVYGAIRKESGLKFENDV